MRWCDEHRNDFPDEEFELDRGTWYHLRDGRHAAEESLFVDIEGDFRGPSDQQ